ncbi:MAG: c-type cytochrome [Sulfurimonas sp.]|nr:c-type cytochrome [Sulfurimonas sp.]MDQ7059934.1 c-type cytochrome [Sulfurimonas sp.]
MRQINSLILLICLALSTSLVAEDYLYDDGKVIYNATCVSCHGTQGDTNDAIMLIVKPRKLTQTILTEAQSFQIIKEGAHHWGAHADMMPTFKYIYKDDEIEGIAHYVSKAFNPNGEARVEKLLKESKPIAKADEHKMLKTGEKIFKRNCSMCHGVTGNGKSEYVEMSKAEDSFMYPYNLQRTLLSQDQIFLYAKFGGKFWGTMEDHMPSWKKKYNDFELKSVAKYVNEKIKKIK